MLFKSFKSILAAAVIATSAVGLPATSANAGTSFGIFIGSGSNGYHNHGGFFLKQKNYGYRKQRKHVHHHRGFCGPRMALHKAWKIGLNRPHVSRIGSHKIVVEGWKRGYRAKLVFAKHSRHCDVIKARGLY